MNQIDKLFDSIKKISKEKTKAYDTQATVTRVDGGTVYVHIPGGVDETPIDKTINANPGDIVQIRVANGRAWATGNASAPPTDDKVANLANSTATTAKQTAGVAQKTAGVAKETAEQAAADVREQKEYFWHDDVGAHVLSDTDEVSGLRYRTDLKGAGQEIFEIDGQNEELVAKFGADGAVVGRDSRMEITGAGIEGFDVDGMSTLAISQSATPTTGTVTMEKVRFRDAAWNQTVIIETDLSEIPANVTTIKLNKDSDYQRNVLEITTGRSPYIMPSAATASSGMSKKANSGGQATRARFSLNTMTITRGTAQTVTAYAEVTLSNNASLRLDVERKYIPSTDTLKTTISTTTQSPGTVESHIRYIQDFTYTRSLYAPDFRFGTRSTGDPGGFSFSSGEELRARYSGQTVVGRFNADLKESAFEVGNGTSGARSNAFDVDWLGNTNASGTITDGYGNSIPRTDHGLTEGVQTNANSYKDLTVPFNKTFSSVPTVVCSIYSTATAGALGSVSVSAINITTTGFTARVFNAGSSPRTPAVSWIAIS